MFRSTFLYLGIFTIFVSIFSLLSILFCYYFDTSLNIQVYFGCLLVSLFLGIIFIFYNKKFFNIKVNFFEKKKEMFKNNLNCLKTVINFCN